MNKVILRLKSGREFVFECESYSLHTLKMDAQYEDDGYCHHGELAEQTDAKSVRSKCEVEIKPFDAKEVFSEMFEHLPQDHPLNEQNNDHDREWIIGCIKHDGFIKTDRFDKANQIILDALSAEQGWIPCSERLPKRDELVLVTYKTTDRIHLCRYIDDGSENPWWSYIDDCCAWNNVVLAWMPLPKPFKGGDEE